MEISRAIKKIARDLHDLLRGKITYTMMNCEEKDERKKYYKLQINSNVEIVRLNIMSQIHHVSFW